ncbi:hypothetical protein [Corynebacterium sp. Marseille-P3884]|uniref:hypothetical protein n=1 Tax=Corynebacterium sp. Marseille-P3884 TaxID=2495409 RepID=UPI001B3348E0|nr:hypothetical protein [Corynebacterium sp. Marseille-P3884]MBP3948950.1 hypothetical protein [Corynebacterium sp. Marseille-P3884]
MPTRLIGAQSALPHTLAGHRPALLFTVANPLCLATGNAMLDEMVTHMPAFMFIALPLIVAAWGAVQIFKGHCEPDAVVEPEAAGRHALT